MDELFSGIHQRVQPKCNARALQLDDLIEDEGFRKSGEALDQIGYSGNTRRSPGRHAATSTRADVFAPRMRSAMRSAPPRSMARHCSDDGGPAFRADTMASARPAAPTSSRRATRPNPRPAIISARRTCSTRGAVRGQMTSGLRAATASTTLLYPPIAITRSAEPIKLSMLLLAWMTSTDDGFSARRSTAAS